MAHQLITMNFLHAAADAGTAAISTQNAVAAGWPVAHLVDRIAGTLMKFNASAADHDIEVDRGAGTLEAIDRLIIPLGHNLSGSTVEVFSDPTPGPTTSRGSAAATAALFSLDFTSNTDRYVRVTFSGSGTWEIPQLFLTRKRTFSKGIDPRWDAPIVEPDSLVESFPGREDVTITAPGRRVLEIEAIAYDGADLTIYDDLVAAVGKHTPFYIDPPDSDLGTLFVRIANDPGRTQDFPAPAAGTVSYTIRLSMVEQL
jgi:hypothetical protein